MPDFAAKYLPADRDFFSSLIESLPLHVFVKNRDGRFIHANRSYCNLIGIPFEKLIGKDDFEIHPHDLAEKYRRDDRRIMENGVTEYFEEKWQSHTNTQDSGWVQTLKAPLRGGDENQIIGTIGIFWDITEKKQSEAALAEERNLLRTLIDNLPDCIFVKDTESRFLLANEYIAQMMGAGSPENLLGRTDEEFYPEELAKSFRSDEERVLQGGEAIRNKEECIPDRDGNTRWMLTTKVPFRNIEGDAAGIIGIGHEVTGLRQAEEERKRLEVQLQHAQKMETIGTLTAGIAHDFNNLLSVINGYTELMRHTAPAGSANYENLGRVLAAGKSAAKLVGQLLAFSRKQVAKSQVISMNSFLLATQTLFQRVIGENVEIQLDCNEQLWPVRIDPAQLQQIVVNFATNARDAMPNGGKLSVRTDNVVVDEVIQARFPSLSPGEWVLLAFQDSGSGISPEVRDHIFEPFFTTKPKDKGTGLGLATVFGIVKQNKGNIFVESHPEKGAEFFVFLPKSDEMLSILHVDDRVKAEKNYRGHETILVVEDDLPLQDLARTILCEHGYTVYTAGNGAEAILAIEQKRADIHLILTDVIMPGMNGKMLADEVVRRKLPMKILFMSGYTGETISQCGILESGVELLQKPFSAQELLQKVRRTLDDQSIG